MERAFRNLMSTACRDLSCASGCAKDRAMSQIHPVLIVRWLGRFLPLFLLSGLVSEGQSVSPASPMTGQSVDFNRDIRRLLSDNCLRCHGPDEHERKGSKASKGGFRLDTREGALARIDDYAAIVPGDPAKSELYLRISTDDENDVMPPVDSGSKLTAREKALLKTWIEQGAPYAQHWAYVVPTRPAAAVVSDPSWPVNPIDSFVLSRLDREKLRPSPAADRPALARRVALDVTGLPPSPQEVASFVADGAPGA